MLHPLHAKLIFKFYQERIGILMFQLFLHILEVQLPKIFLSGFLVHKFFRDPADRLLKPPLHGNRIRATAVEGNQPMRIPHDIDV
ncbi:hypothetical protein SDC9_175837 [bioreactor metagenome]|uniref:Uncharacterized protein n=1 Tax=bioreactor metagenome TaxID=1076179 RepID=A0A645GQD3_9ZZZZ